jgi:hypothetical protein
MVESRTSYPFSHPSTNGNWPSVDDVQLPTPKPKVTHSLTHSLTCTHHTQLLHSVLVNVALAAWMDHAELELGERCRGAAMAGRDPVAVVHVVLHDGMEFAGRQLTQIGHVGRERTLLQQEHRIRRASQRRILGRRLLGRQQGKTINYNKGSIRRLA